MRITTIAFTAVSIGVAGFALQVAPTPAFAASYSKVPAPRLAIENDAPVETAVFAGGCFWGVEAVFEQMKGVKSAVSGFSGGSGKSVSYDQVTRGGTGHAEAVRVTFDPRVTSYAELMQVYFSVIADPTQLNRQGPDVGKHYRTAFFPITKAQDRQARAYIAQLGKAGVYDKPIVTTIEPYSHFVTAEAYHQDFMKKNPRHPYIRAHDVPKVKAFKRLFPSMVG